MRPSGPSRGIRATQAGLAVNVGLVLVKMAAGVVGRSSALIADAVESSTDVFSSLIVWGGLSVAATPADEEHPFGHGKAESIAGAAVALLLVAAALGIAAAAVRRVGEPHEVPAAFTLLVAGGVIVVKEGLFRFAHRVGTETGSGAVRADAWHHRSDAVSSAAAFLGIAAARLGGPAWGAADDAAALVAAGIIGLNGVLLLRPAIHDLMDRMPDRPVVSRIEAAAHAVAGVRAIEKLRVRKVGTGYAVDLHVQADPSMTLRDAHSLGGRVKASIREALPAVFDATIHMEPFDEPGA